MINKGMYYVYALIDPRSQQPFYIGKGKESNQRHLDHLKETKERNSNRHKYFRIRDIQKSGYEVEVLMLHTNIKDEDTAYKLEEKLILEYGRMNIEKGGILTNYCLGNRPPSALGKKQSLQHIRRRVASYRRTVAKNGKTVSPETRKKISESMKGEKNPFYGKTHSVSARNKVSQWRKANPDHVPNAKTYLFSDPNGKEHIVKGSFYQFCRDNGLAISTMEKILYNGKYPKKGNCVGWNVKKINHIEPKEGTVDEQ